MIVRLSHLGICVPDLDQAIAFYRDVFGFAELSRVNVRGASAETLMQLPDVRVRAVFLEREGTRIELLHYKAPSARPQAPRALNDVGLTHLSFRVSDIEAVIARVEAAGGSALRHTLVEQDGFKSAFVLDPGNTRIELLQMPTPRDWLPGMPL